MKIVSQFRSHYSSDYTEDVYVHGEEIAYDCAQLSEAWEEIRPLQASNKATIELWVPFDDSDFYAFL